MQIVMLVLLALLSIIPILTARETLKMRKEIQLDNWSIRPVFNQSQIERRKLLSSLLLFGGTVVIFVVILIQMF